jgi:hypothetical protein
MFPIDVLRFSEFRTMRNHLSETLMLNDIQITSDYMSRLVVLKRRVGAVTIQRVLKVLFYANILQCFFVVENVTANRSLIQGRIHKLKTLLIVDLSLYLKTNKLLSVFPLFMTNMLLFLRTRLPTISCLYVNHITSKA